MGWLPLSTMDKIISQNNTLPITVLRDFFVCVGHNIKKILQKINYTLHLFVFLAVILKKYITFVY